MNEPGKLLPEKSLCNIVNNYNKNNRDIQMNQKSSFEMSQFDTNSDCGYGTQVSQENQESISTSSNDDESPRKKPVHQKPPSTNQKQRFNAAQKQRNAVQSAQDKKELRRKKLVKRSKSSM